MSAWYEDWFNSDAYLTVYSHRDQHEADEFASTISKIVTIPQKGRILDLACGAGRHAIAFAKLGYSVTAVDLSPRLLEIGEAKAKAAGLLIEFRRANLLDFESPAVYSAVLNVFTSFGYFQNDADNFRIFKVAHEALLKGGCFIFDFMNEQFVRDNFVPHSKAVVNGITVEQTRVITATTVDKTILLSSDGKEQSYSESVKLYSPEILQEQLSLAGFGEIKLLGNYEGNEFIRQTSPRFIAICRKN